jgi:hypothetical protein
VVAGWGERKQWGNFFFATRVFAHFAFATLTSPLIYRNGHFAFALPVVVMYQFCPMWGETKMKMMSSCYICPQWERITQKQDVKIYSGKSKMGKF